MLDDKVMDEIREAADKGYDSLQVAQTQQQLLDITFEAVKKAHDMLISGRPDDCRKLLEGIINASDSLA